MSTVSTAAKCTCDCHAGPFVLCTIPGGCRSAGCTRQGRTPGSCPCCWRRNPDPTRGDGRVCGPCERWLPILIRSIVDKTTELPELILSSDAAVDDRWYWHEFPRRKDPDTGELLPPEGEWRRADPLAATGGAGPVPGRRKDPKVSSTRPGSPAPVRLDVLDLLGPVVRGPDGQPVDGVTSQMVVKLRAGDKVEHAIRELRMVPVRDKDGWIVGEELAEHVRTVTVHERVPVPALGRTAPLGETEHLIRHLPRNRPFEPPFVRAVLGGVAFVSADDQVGHVPVAQVLDQEARAWLDAGAPGRLPVPTVAELGDWLLRRLPWAIEHYGPIDEARITLSRLRGTLMAVLDEFDPPPELCVGVECNRCDKRLLYRRHDGTGDVECQACGKILTASDYVEWAKRQGAWEASRRTPQEVANLLRPTYRRPADTPTTSGDV